MLVPLVGNDGQAHARCQKDEGGGRGYDEGCRVLLSKVRLAQNRGKRFWGPKTISGQITCRLTRPGVGLIAAGVWKSGLNTGLGIFAPVPNCTSASKRGAVKSSLVTSKVRRSISVHVIVILIPSRKSIQREIHSKGNSFEYSIKYSIILWRGKRRACHQ